MRKYLLFGCGIVAVLVLLVVTGLGMRLSPGPEGKNLESYHPFRSATAKDNYLKAYDTKAKKWPVASEARMVKTSFGETFVRVSGPPAAPPLVLLHGMGGTSLQWMSNVKALSGNYRTYAVDNIYDNGRSVPTKAIRSSDDYVKWLDELFNALGLKNDINLMGVSYGGWLASQYALHLPDRLNKLVLVAPVCTVLPLPFEWIGRALLCTVPHRYFTRSFMYWLLEDLAKKDEASRNMLDDEVDFAYLTIRSFKQRRQVNPTVLDDGELRGIRVPTLFLVGENEKLYSAPKAVERLHKIAPRIQTGIIPHAGHDVTVVQADMVNMKVLAFLKQQRP